MGFLPLSSLPVDAHIVNLFLFLPPRGGDRLEFWVGVRQHPTGGKFTEEEGSFDEEGYRLTDPADIATVHIEQKTGPTHRVLCRVFQVIPVLNDVRMGFAPRHFNLFGQRVTHHNPIPAGHRLEGADAPLVAKGELLDLADEALIFRHLFHGDPERFCIAQFVDVRAFLPVIR